MRRGGGFKRARRILIVALILAIGGCCAYFIQTILPETPIRVGLLNALSGPLGVNGAAVRDVTQFAIEEINESGGLLGRKVEGIEYDYGENPANAETGAERLILEKGVDVIFGCWTSASRKAAKLAVEKHRSLLFYPVQYEGLEESKNIVYTGATPNQQIIPAVKWAFDNIGKRFFLVGSDYVFPHSAHTIIRDELVAINGEVVGEEYAALTERDFSGIISKIVAAKPDVILNTINGVSNLEFFRQLRAAGVTPQQIPTVSFSFGENLLSELAGTPMDGDFASGNYFQTISSDANRDFQARFRARFGSKRVIDDAMVSMYAAVKLWAQAVRDADSSEPANVNRTILHQTFESPAGMFYVDPPTRNTWNVVRLAKVTNGRFAVVWSSDVPVRPDPFPFFRRRAEWESFLTDLYEGWGKAWVAPQR